MSCGVGRRRDLDPVLLWLWGRLAAVALIQPLAWELPYAMGMAFKKQKKKKIKKKEIKKESPAVCVCVCFFNFNFLEPHPWHMEVPRIGVKSIRGVPAGLHHSHNNTGFEPCL